MNNKFFPELARRLKREGISTGPVEKGCLPVLADGQAAVLVMSHGTVAFNADVERGPEADSVYTRIRPPSRSTSPGWPSPPMRTGASR